MKLHRQSHGEQPQQQQQQRVTRRQVKVVQPADVDKQPKFEPPISLRESWWRANIKDTPNPGKYETRGFTEDLKSTIYTYNFKNAGRKVDPYTLGRGATLLPGAYTHEDFVMNLEKDHGSKTYRFKDTSRDKILPVDTSIKDKDVDIPPGAYEVQRYLSVSADPAPSSHSFFKSQSSRFPTIYFRPKSGVGPGKYDAPPSREEAPVTSSFRSRTVRFRPSNTRVPGPGSYFANHHRVPSPASLLKLSREYGLYFSYDMLKAID